MRAKKLWSLLSSAILLASVFAGPAQAAPASQAPAHGTVKPFALNVQALKGMHHTDLYLSVDPVLASFLPPDALNKVQLKSFTPDGKLRYTRNFMDVAAPGGDGVIQLADVDRHQPLKTQVNVKTAQTVNEEVLEAQAVVLLRPDLVVESVESPPKVPAGAPFVVSTVIRETNGDLGATANVRILNGPAVLDYANGVQVHANATQGVTFGLKLDEPGVYNLVVNIDGAEPGEYDTSNNEKAFTVEVVANNETMTYNSSYDYQEFYEDNGDWHSWWGAESWRRNGSREVFWLNSWTDKQIQLGNEPITVTWNTEAGVPSTATFTTWYSYYGWHSGYDPITNSYMDVYAQPWGSWFSLHRYSGFEQYSYWYSYYWGSWGGSGTAQWGQMMGARETLAVHIEIPDATGKKFGGNYSISLSPYEYTWNWVYDDWWWGYWYRFWGHIKGFSGYSYGQTTW